MPELTHSQRKIFGFEHWVAIVSTLALIVLSAYTAFVAYGAVQVPTYIAAIGVLLLIVALYGRRVLRRGSDRAIYYYGCVVYCFTVLLIISLGLLMINVNRGQEYIEENWYSIQTAVLPFTTELDTFKGIASNCLWILYVGILTVILFMPRLDGSGRPAMMFPLLFPQLLLAGVVIYFGLSGIKLTSFASDQSAVGMALAAASAVGHFLAAVVCITAVVRKPKNAGAYLSGGVLASPFSLLSIAMGVNLLIQQAGVSEFVKSNWPVVLQMVPSRYQQLSMDKYIVDSQDAFNFTAWLGLVLGFTSLMYVICTIRVGVYMSNKEQAAELAKSGTPSRYMSTGDSGFDGHVPATPPPPLDHAVSLRPSSMVARDSTAVPVRPDKSGGDGGSPSGAAGTGEGGGGASGSGGGGDKSHVLSTPLVAAATATPRDVLRDHFQEERRSCIIATVVGTIVFVAAVTGVGLVAVEDGKCGVVVRGPDAGVRVYNISFHADFLEKVNVDHTFPKGSSTILFKRSPDRALEVQLKLYGRTEADVAPANDDVNPLTKAATYSKTTKTLDVTVHPEDLARVTSECLAAELVVLLPEEAFALQINAKTGSALNNLTSHAFGIIPRFDTLDMRSDSGSISVNGVTALGDVTVKSGTGRVRVDSVAGSNMYVETTDSDLIAINATSFDTGALAFSNMTLIGHGMSNVIITDIFAGLNASVTAEKGDVIGVVSAVGIEDTLFLHSDEGDIFLNTFVMAVGARSILSTTTGEVKVAAMTTNTLHITTTTGDVSLYEVFMGLGNPGIGDIKYPTPLLKVVTQSGTITGLGCGATPSSSTFKEDLSMYFQTDSSPIKIEVNGGGFAGNYSVATQTGSTQVSVDGELRGNHGTVAYLGKGLCSLTSNSGDLELAVLPGPLGL